MKQYEVIYLKALNKLVLYHGYKIVFEGTSADLLDCGNKLLECRQEDINKIVEDAEQAFAELNKLFDNRLEGKI